MKISKPNILFILADDLGWGDVSSHGSQIRTPNIDLLMSEGVEFKQHYVQPMCTPTRASLLSGRYPSRFGKHATIPSNRPVFPDGYQTLASVLRDSGYETGLFGKGHLGSTPGSGPNNFGFDYSYGSLAGGVDPFNHMYKKGEFSVTWNRNGEYIKEFGHVTDLIFNEAINWIENRNSPWFCYVPFTAVHVPVKPNSFWANQYNSQRFDEDNLKDNSFKKYAAYASHMDYAIGELIKTLEQKGERENTIIVFSSDNGAIDTAPIHQTDQYPGWQEELPRLGSNLPFRGLKSQLYEGGIRTPTVINWKDSLGSGKVEEPVHISDWMPTFSNLLDLKIKDDPKWDGHDIWDLILGNSVPNYSREIYWNFKAEEGLCIRDGDWKLISSKNENQIKRKLELFNICEDPFETDDISEKQIDKVNQLESKINKELNLDYLDVRNDLDRYFDPLYN